MLFKLFKPFILFYLKSPRYKRARRLAIVTIFARRRISNLPIKTYPLVAYV
jgi:hypothetical protein